MEPKILHRKIMLALFALATASVLSISGTAAQQVPPEAVPGWNAADGIALPELPRPDRKPPAMPPLVVPNQIKPQPLPEFDNPAPKPPEPEQQVAPEPVPDVDEIAGQAAPEAVPDIDDGDESTDSSDEAAEEAVEEYPDDEAGQTAPEAVSEFE